MAKIKTDENAAGASNQEPTAGVSGITSKARNVVKSRRSIYNPMAMT